MTYRTEADAEFARILRQYLSDCRAWLDDDIKGAIKRAIEVLEEGESWQ